MFKLTNCFMKDTNVLYSQNRDIQIQKNLKEYVINFIVRNNRKYILKFLKLAYNKIKYLCNEAPVRKIFLYDIYTFYIFS